MPELSEIPPAAYAVIAVAIYALPKLVRIGIDAIADAFAKGSQSTRKEMQERLRLRDLTIADLQNEKNQKAADLAAAGLRLRDLEIELRDLKVQRAERIRIIQRMREMLQQRGDFETVDMLDSSDLFPRSEDDTDGMAAVQRPTIVPIVEDPAGD